MPRVCWISEEKCVRDEISYLYLFYAKIIFYTAPQGE